MSSLSSKADLDVVSSEQGAISQGAQQLDVEAVKRRSIHGAATYVMRTAFLTGLAIVAQGVLSTVLGPEEVGIYGIVVTISGFFTIISDVGLAASLIQKKDQPTLSELRTVFTVQQLLAWVVCLFLTTTSIVLVQNGKMSQDGLYLALAFGLTFPIVSFKTISSILLERELAFTGLVTTAVVEGVVFNAVLIWLATHGYGVHSYTAAVLTKAIIGVIVLLSFKRWSLGLAFSWERFRTLMRVGGGFQLNDMLAKAKDDLFYLVLAFFITPGEFGYLTWSRQWSRLPYSLTVDNISALTFPAFSRLQHDERLLRRAIEKTIFFVTLVSFPMLGGIAVMVTPLVHVFPEWAKWQPAIFSLILFCFSLAFSSFSTPLINTLNALGKIRETLKMMTFWTIGQWLLAIVFIRWYAYEGVAIIAALLAIPSLYVVLLVKKYVTFSFTEQVWRQTFATITMIGILYAGQSLWQQSLLFLCAGIAVGGTVFVLLMALTGFEKIRTEIASLLRRR